MVRRIYQRGYSTIRKEDERIRCWSNSRSVLPIKYIPVVGRPLTKGNFVLIASPTAQNATKSPSVSGDIQKVVEAATKAALSGGDPSMETTLNEAIRGLAVNPDMLNVRLIHIYKPNNFNVHSVFPVECNRV